jgi:DNA replication protein DnaC
MSDLKTLAKKLGLKALCANWDTYCHQPWVKPLLEDEEAERVRLGLERHQRDAKIGEFKPMADFNWNWPEEIDRELVEELLTLRFLGDKGTNVVFVGPNGIGKTMIVQNIAYGALAAGMRTRFVPASQMLSELSRQDGDLAFNRCLKKYCNYDLLLIDELGYLDYGTRYADLLFQVISGRYQKRSTIVTTNKSFQEWNTIFPNAMCVTTLVDRLMHKAELVVIKGKSYREHEAIERAQAKAAERRARSKPKAGKGGKTK